MVSKKNIPPIILVIVSIVCCGVLFVSACISIFTYNTPLPTGKEFYRCSSPDGKHTLIAYISESSLSAPALRGEIQENKSGKCWTVYWQYKPEAQEFSWKDNDTVIINGIELNIHTDRYDYRRGVWTKKWG